MKKTIIPIAAALVAVLPARAQQPESDLNRQMDVTRDYEPRVRKADKLGIAPNMVDTVALRPEVHYEVHPSPINYGFDVTPIKPVQVSLDEYRRLQPFYLKAGAGAPFQSVLDAYFSSTQKTDGKWGVFLNHYGSWSDIKNVNGIKTPAAQTFNKVGLYGEHRFGRNGRFGVRGELGYDYDKVSRYGYDTVWNDWMANNWTGIKTVKPDLSSSALRQNFSTVHGKIGLGHSFEDLSYFNVRFGFEGAYFQDRFDMKQADVKGYLDMGKLFGGRHEVTLHVGYDYYKGSGELSDYKDGMLSLRPLYRLKAGKAEFSLGAEYVLDNDGDRNESAFFPLFGFQWNTGRGGFVPYLNLDGRYVNNGYRHLASVNPYVWQGTVGRNTAEYNARVGFKGSAASTFSYNVFGGYSRYRNMNYFMNYVNNMGDLDSEWIWWGNTFIVQSSDVSMWTLGGEIEARVSNSFGLELGVQYRGYDKIEVEQENLPVAVFRTGLPSLTANLGIKYSYRDKFLLKAGVDVCGPRDFTVFVERASYFPENSYIFIWDPLGRFRSYLADRHVDMQFDVHLGAEYNFSRKIGIFVEGRNLANQKLFYYNQYPALGINFLAGVKLQF